MRSYPDVERDRVEPESEMLVGPIRQVILQATSFCNIDCSYCYIPAEFRDRKRHMSEAVAKAAMRLVWESGLAHRDLELRWHDGEPLARGIAFYRAVFAWIQSAQPRDIRTWNSLQTNGVLIDQVWAKLFLEHCVAVGVSLDGPQDLHDARRKDRRGQGTYTRVLQGIEHLHRLGCPFDVICVVGEEALDRPDEIYDFFDGLGVRCLGLNVDDFIWQQQSAFRIEERLRCFLSQLHRRWCTGRLRIREFEDMEARVLHAWVGTRSMPAEPLSILNVSAEGALSTFSPELLMLPGDRGDVFAFGTVWMSQLADILMSIKFRSVSGRVRMGVKHCRTKCDYFSLCGGGSPANKLFETGDLAADETAFCRWRIQHVADLIMNDLLARRHSSARP